MSKKTRQAIGAPAQPVELSEDIRAAIESAAQAAMRNYEELRERIERYRLGEAADGERILARYPGAAEELRASAAGYAAVIAEVGRVLEIADAELRGAVLALGASVSGSNYQTTYGSGVKWDDDYLRGYAAAGHPEILEARVEEPRVSIRPAPRRRGQPAPAPLAPLFVRDFHSSDVAADGAAEPAAELKHDAIPAPTTFVDRQD